MHNQHTSVSVNIPDIKKPLERYAVRVFRLSCTQLDSIVVETAGIEPASANTLPEGATCLGSVINLANTASTGRKSIRDSS